VHALPGRVRVHVPEWEGQGKSVLEARLWRVRGVSDVRSSSLTRNVLVRFDLRVIDDASILAALRGLKPDEDEEIEEVLEATPAQREGRDPAGRVRITVRGLDRDPELARRMVERLESHPSLRATMDAKEVGVVADHRRLGAQHPLGGPGVGLRAEPYAVGPRDHRGCGLRGGHRVGGAARSAPDLHLRDFREHILPNFGLSEPRPRSAHMLCQHCS
jgi:hypothetical protein